MLLRRVVIKSAMSAHSAGTAPFFYHPRRVAQTEEAAACDLRRASAPDSIHSSAEWASFPQLSAESAAKNAFGPAAAGITLAASPTPAEGPLRPLGDVGAAATATQDTGTPVQSSLAALASRASLDCDPNAEREPTARAALFFSSSRRMPTAKAESLR